MRKVIYNQYGGPEVLELVRDAPVPPLTTVNSILVRVKAVSLNPLDWKIRRGDLKVLTGSKMPQPMGSDFSGVVTKVGPGVTDYKEGDEVMGIADAFSLQGSLADYIAVSPKRICKKPASMSFEDASTVGIAGVAALECIDRVGRVKKGQDVLILGVTGGVGLFACQIAKLRGAKVTGVCSTHGIATAKNVGCDEVVDYTTSDILKSSQTFDKIIFLNSVGTYSTYRHLLKPTAIFVNCTPSVYEMLTDTIRNLFFRQKNRIMFADVNAKTIKTVADLMVDQGVRTFIAKSFPLTQIKEAYEFAEKGKFIGKVIISMEED